MPIEFRCPGCAKLLRTPDESAGKKAKCPQCGAIADVPLLSADVSDPFPSSSPPAEREAAGYVYSDFAPRRDSFPGTDMANPYASPVAAPSLTDAKLAAAQLVHRQTTIDEVLQRSWAVFQTQMGPCALVGLVFIAITFGVSMATSMFRVAAQMAQDPVIMVLAFVAEQIVSFLINTFFALGMILVAIRLARTGVVQLNDLFSGGPYYVRGLLAGLLFWTILLGAGVVCVGPGLATILTEEPAIFGPAIAVGAVVWAIFALLISLRFFLINLFIVDRNLGVMDSFQASAQYMAGNKLAAFLGWLVVSILGGVVVLCTCLIGSVLVAPFTSLFIATLYLMVTGQPMYSPPQARPVLSTPPPGAESPPFKDPSS